MELGFNRATLRGVIVETPQLKRGCVFFTLAWLTSANGKLNYVKGAIFGEKAVEFSKVVKINSTMIVDGYLDTIIFPSYVGVRIIVNSWFLQHMPVENHSHISQMYEESVTNKLKRIDYTDPYNPNP